MKVHTDNTPDRYAVVNGKSTGYRTCSCGHVIKTDAKYVELAWRQHLAQGA